MMLAGPTLRTVPLTVHTSLASVPGLITPELVERRSAITAAALARDFGLPSPRLAIAALNPHAGEEGRMGDEEGRLIEPAIAALRARGIDATGPHPADALFAERARATYDVAICMYHDQALIPLKALDFDQGVNVTLGLPIIRTSPDHGTAFAIAGATSPMRAPPSRPSAWRATARRAGRKLQSPHEIPTSPSPAPLREVINAHGLFATKALGQNFLFDEQLLDRLAAIPGSLMDANVLEVGPGPGGLTRALLRAGAKVTAIEMDKRALPVLEELSQAFPGRLTVIHGDATKVDPASIFGAEPYAIVANLPYNVGTNLFTGWLSGATWPPQWTSLTLMFQLEVAERIIAQPGSDALWAAGRAFAVALQGEDRGEGPSQRLHPAAQGDERHGPCGARRGARGRLPACWNA
jgi:hypothetical protein